MGLFKPRRRPDWQNEILRIDFISWHTWRLATKWSVSCFLAVPLFAHIFQVHLWRFAFNGNRLAGVWIIYSEFTLYRIGGTWFLSPADDADFRRGFFWNRRWRRFSWIKFQNVQAHELTRIGWRKASFPPSSSQRRGRKSQNLLDKFTPHLLFTALAEHDFFLPQMTLTFAEVFWKPQIAPITLIFCQLHIFADFFLPQMTLTFAEVFLKPQMTQIFVD